MEPECVFVYGGLMRGFDLHHYLDGSSFVGEGAVRGALVSLGQYPGLVDGDGEVRGEVYHFDDLAAALDILDDVEDYNPADTDHSLYVRVAVPVAMADGGALNAWAYRYNRGADAAPRIASGDWRRPSKRS